MINMMLVSLETGHGIDWTEGSSLGTILRKVHLGEELADVRDIVEINFGIFEDFCRLES